MYMKFLRFIKLYTHTHKFRKRNLMQKKEIDQKNVNDAETILTYNKEQIQ